MTQRVKLYKTLWGAVDLDKPPMWDSMLGKIKADGFQGVELCGPAKDGPFYPFGAGQSDLLKNLLLKHDLGLIMQLHTMNYPVPVASLGDHVDSLRSKAEQVATEFPGVEIINVHSGKDCFKLSDSIKFFEEAVKIEKDIGKCMTHETHRQRIIFSPMVLRELDKDLPASLKLNADLSHFCCVCERVFDKEHDADIWPETLKIVADRCHLIHARVGYSQGPQVNDPFAPEHADTVKAHMAWWKEIVASMRRRGVLPIVEPEFGPYPYQPHLPYSNVPTTDLSEINRKFGQFLVKELN